MKMSIYIILLTIFLITGCTSSENKASGLLETARFEEKQNNREHALKLYQEIIDKHPATAASKTAAERLKELQPIKP